MIIVSNISDAIKNDIAKIKSLKDPDKTTRILAFDTVAIVSDRIQQKGLKSDGTLIQGKYSGGYSNKRENKGLQTNYVDLTFSGDMMADFLPVQDGPIWGAGFTGKKNADVAEYNERRFGKIFDLTKEEEKVIENSFNAIVKKLLK